MEPLPDQTVGEGLAVRRWVAADVVALHHAVLANLDHLRPWMAWIGAEPLTIAERAALIERWEHEWLGGGDVVVGIWCGGVVVGGAGLHRRIGRAGLEIGYWVHAEHVGQGIATRAARALTHLAFTVDAIDRVEIHHDVTNTPSRRVPEKLGFVSVGEAASPRDPRAPAETGTDRIWRAERAWWPPPVP